MRRKQRDSETFKNFETRFISHVSRFNSSRKGSELPSALVSFLLLANSRIGTSQSFSFISAALHRETDIENKEAKDILPMIKFYDIATVVRTSLVKIILVFGRNIDRNVQRFVNGRFGDRIWTYLCIKINVSNHIQYFVGPNDIHVRSKSRPKIVILHLQSLYKVAKKFFYDVFGPNRLLEIHKYVHNRSLKRPFTKRCTFRSLLRPKTRIKSS